MQSIIKQGYIDFSLSLSLSLSLPLSFCYFFFFFQSQSCVDRNSCFVRIGKVEELDAVIQILRQIITSGTVIKCPALFRSRKCVAWLAFLVDHYGILSGIGGLFNSRHWGRGLPRHSRRFKRFP